MNLNALKEICTNKTEILEESARDNNADENTVVGIAKLAASKGYGRLTEKQKFHFDNCIMPLIENVQCIGYTHECEDGKIICNAILDDDDLVDHYRNNGKYCERCEAQASADAHSKNSFFRD